MKFINSFTYKQQFITTIVLVAVAISVQMAKADMIPYSHAGMPTSDPGKFIAGVSGDVWAYYTGSEAGYTDLAGLSINGNTPTSWVFNNHPNKTPGTTQIGDAIDLGSVTIGQIISFWLQVTPPGGLTYIVKSTLPTPTSPGTIFSTTLTDGSTYVGFEDLTAKNDYDYNDDTFAFSIQPSKTGNANTVVPEPTTVIAGALLLLPFGVSAVRILRARKKMD